MTGLETMNEKEKVDAEKFIHQHVTVNVNRRKVKRIGNAIGWQSCPRKKNCMLWRQMESPLCQVDCTFRQSENGPGECFKGAMRSSRWLRKDSWRTKMITLL